MLIDCQKVTIEFPIYNAAQRSFKKTLFSAASGGRIGNAAGTTVITALDDISFHLQDGDRLALIGHNGCGKTTLLRTLAGVYTPIRGHITRHGCITSLIDATLGMDPELTGLENIKIKSLFLGIAKHQLANLIEDVVDFSELGDFIHLPVRTYSSGMVLRLAFALSTTSPPEILLMDEWMSVGDEQFCAKAEQRLLRFVQSAGILVMATHDVQLAHRVCNQFLHLKQGKVIS